MSISLKPQRCGDCGYDYRTGEPETDRYKVGLEIVYMASKGIDEPWFCSVHRQHV